jgi:hypothetical protein
MREYALIAPTFWTGETGKKITQKGLATRVLATYLLTNPHATSLGLYYLAVPFIIHETGLSKREIEKAFRELGEEGIEFALYDYATEFVWVPEMAAYQLHYLKPGDNRLKPILRLWDSLAKNPFLAAFFEKYGSKYGFAPKILQGLAKGLIQGLVSAPTSPQIVTDQDKETGIDTETDISCSELQNEAPEQKQEPEEALLTFPTAGKTKEWAFTTKKLAEYQETFPALDVLAVCRVARQWCIDNPQKRKTAKGMPRFLTSWLGKAQDGPRGGYSSQSQISPEVDKIIRAFKIAQGKGDDPKWDDLRKESCIQPAEKLLSYFGRFDHVVLCIEAVSQWAKESGMRWGWDAVSKSAPDFKVEMEKKERNYEMVR